MCLRHSKWLNKWPIGYWYRLGVPNWGLIMTIYFYFQLAPLTSCPAFSALRNCYTIWLATFNCFSLNTSLHVLPLGPEISDTPASSKRLQTLLSCTTPTGWTTYFASIKLSRWSVLRWRSQSKLHLQTIWSPWMVLSLQGVFINSSWHHTGGKDIAQIFTWI